jgi:hypothetical protein
MSKGGRIRQLFLLDGLGASVSTVMLGWVLPRYEALFGMPPKVLYGLACLAAIFAIYSWSCFFSKPAYGQPYLKVIATANLLYCGLTLGLIMYWHSHLSLLGITYFVAEISLILVLALLELKTAAASLS